MIYARSGDPRRAWAARIDQGHVPAVRAEAATDDAPPTLYLYDPIDDWFGITASDFQLALAGLGDVDQLQLRINSPGGFVDDGLAILNLLRSHPARTTGVVDGLAASAASFIATGLDELVMMPNSQLMIHDAWGIAIGPAATMDEASQLLNMQSDNIARIYADKAGGDAADWRGFMRAETWYLDQEAVDAGLADTVNLAAQGDSSDQPAPELTENLAVSRQRAAARAAAVWPSQAIPTHHVAPAAARL